MGSKARKKPGGGDRKLRISEDSLEIREAKPELFFGLVAAVGAPISFFTSILETELEDRGYIVETIHVSEFLEKKLKLTVPPVPGGSAEFRRIYELMERGNALRKTTGRNDVLARMTAASINTTRPKKYPRHRPGRAYVIRQLKHQDEVHFLRSVYQDAFFLIGLHCPRERRKEHLTVVRGMKVEESQTLIKKDEAEEVMWGQHLRDAFHLADVFIDYPGAEDTQEVQEATARFINVLFGATNVSPRKDEYGMFLARAAALRSLDLSRQVGAAILNDHGDVLAVGTNEVPSPGGGQYWEGDAKDARDVKLGFDSNDREQNRILLEILERIEPKWDRLSTHRRHQILLERIRQLEGARVANLTEFGRAVHAELAALLTAARNGTAIGGATLYSTTFPCHNCAKHIIAAGLKRVVYVEPYPKSLAQDLHSDAINIDEKEKDHRVRFTAFAGIAPRRFKDLFSVTTPEGRRWKRKDASGRLRKEPWGVRVQELPISYIELETLAAEHVQTLIPKG